MNGRILLALLLAFAAAGCGGPEPAGKAPADRAAAEPPRAPAPLPPGLSPPAHPVPTRSDAIPSAFHGVYDASAAACGRPSEYRLAVSALELRFHESAAIVRGVTVDSPESIHVAADYQGEGESWSAVRQLRLTESGSKLGVTGDGTAFVRVRCAVPTESEPSAG